MITIASILAEMKKAVENKEIISPDTWINWALSLNTLQQDLKIELVKAEINYKREVNELLEENPKLSLNRAELKIQSKLTDDGKMSFYELYKYLAGRDKLVEEFIKLAKRRAQVEQTF